MAKKGKRHTGAKRKPVKRKRRPVRRKKVSGAKRKPAKRKAVKRKAAKRKPATRKKRSPGRKLVKQVERRSVERVMAGRRRRRKAPAKRSVVMAGSRRSVGGKGSGSKLLIGLAIGAAAIYFLTKKTTASTYPTNYQLPPLTQTSNYTRNTQSQDIVNYALAAGLAIDAITKLIDKLNTSSDQEVQNTYDVINTSGASAFDYYV